MPAQARVLLLELSSMRRCCVSVRIYMKSNGAPCTVKSRLGDIVQVASLLRSRFKCRRVVCSMYCAVRGRRQYVHSAVRWPLYRDHVSNVVASFRGNLQQDVARVNVRTAPQPGAKE